MDALWDFLRGRAPKWQGPFPRYSAAGDMLEVHFEDVPAFADQIAPTITLLRAMSDKRVVGVKVFDVKAVILAAPDRE